VQQPTPARVRPGRLGPAELAEAAVLADLAVLVTVLGRLTPLTGVLPVFASVPFAVLALRHRARVVVVGAAVGLVVGFLLAGIGAATSMVVAVLWGAVAGLALRRGWGPLRSFVVTLGVGWTAVAGATVAALTVLGDLRRLTLDSITVQWQGIERLLRRAGFEAVADRADPVVTAAVDRWWLVIPLLQLVLAVGLWWLVRRFAAPVLRRVGESLAPPGPFVAPSPGPAGPVPVTLHDVVVHRGGRPVLRIDDLVLDAGGLVVLWGPNGAGKSTLLSVLAGAAITGGRIDRPGTPGLGATGGTAVVGQRPESQVVGARVIDDLAWGLDGPLDDERIDQVLAEVGLEAMAYRETAVLSGGQLQRLALAGAVLRRPALLLSDESTAMLDPEGRARVLALLRRLADEGVTVVHATHLPEELAVADRVVDVLDGSVRR
jgi:energy-coupling factor transport system permease/ATP-binding protein